MQRALFNKYRAAIELLQRGRESLVDDLADEIVDQGNEFRFNAYTFNELLETQGTRLHFLSLLITQLEQSAEAFDEAQAALPQTPPKAPTRRRRRASTKKLQQASQERSPEDTSS